MLTKSWFLVLVGSLSLIAGCGAYAWEPMRVGSAHAPVARRTPVVPRRSVAPPTAEAIAHVLLLEGAADRPCEVLGLIDQHGRMGHEAEALERLRADAARVGADAVLHVQFDHSEGDHDHDARVDEGTSGDFSGEHEEDLDAATDEAAEHGGDPLALHLSGTAVRFRDLIGGRPYEVLGHVEVTEGMTHEEQALAQLRARGRALHADLIIGIAFHHDGDEAGGVGVEGTAIRFVR